MYVRCMTDACPMHVRCVPCEGTLQSDPPVPRSHHFAQLVDAEHIQRSVAGVQQRGLGLGLGLGVGRAHPGQCG